jgi:FHS family glucose/mannose:H+ symporter-like MFS transporter
MRPAGPHRSPLEAIAYAGMFVFGLVTALLGAVMPVLFVRLALRLEDIGTAFLAMNGGMLAASLLVGPTMDRFGVRAPLASGALLVAAALLGIASAWSLPELLAAASVLGLGGGALNAGTSTLIADLHDTPETKAAALNVLGVFFGFGALVLPLAIAALLAHVGLAPLLWAASTLCAVAGVMAAGATFPPAKQAHGLHVTDIRRLLRMPLVVTLGCLLFFQSGSEFTLGGYFSTFATRELRMSVAAASYLLSAYWAALMLSRVALSRLVLRLGAYRVVGGCALVASCGSLALAAASGAPMATLGVLVTGLAFAGIFPTVLGVAAAAFPSHSGTVFGILLTVALTGGMTMPWFAGHMARAAGLRSVFALVAVAFLVIGMLSLIARRVAASYVGGNGPTGPGLS